MKRKHLIISVSLALSLCIIVPAYASEMVAKVNNVPITEGELQAAVSSYIPSGVFHGQSVSDKREKYRKEALEDLIEKELVYQSAIKTGVVVDKKEVDDEIQSKISQFPSKKEYRKALKQAGLTDDIYRKIFMRDLTVKKFKKEVLEKGSAYSDEELEAYYKDNRANFQRPESFRVSHIYINIPPNSLEKERGQFEKRAKDLYEKIRSGEDFAKVAYESSEDQYRIKGGDLGWVHSGRLFKEVDLALKEMEVGELRLIESLYGYHIVLLKDKRPPQQMELSEVRDTLRLKLEKKRYKEKEQELIKKLRDRAVIEIMDKG